MADLGSSTINQTDASNASGTMPSWSGSAAPSTLDDAGRALQGAVAREWNWRSYTLTASGTNTKTLTYSVAPAAYYNGQRFAFLNGTTITGSTTLNVNSLGAKTIKKMVSGTATDLASGDMVAGAYVEVTYNTAGDYFVWVNRGGDVFLSAQNTFTTSQFISTSSTDAVQYLSANAGKWKYVQMRTGTSPRWTVGSLDNAETGSNAGSDFRILRYDDAGGYLADAMKITRSTGLTTFESLQVSGTITYSGSGSGLAYSLGSTGNNAIRDQTNGASSIYFDVSTGGATHGSFIFRSSNAYTEWFRIDGSGNALVTGPGGLGYGTGSGGTVTQATSKSTGVTLNKTNGQIVTHNATLNAGVDVTFTVTNSTVAATDTIVIHRASGGTASTYLATIDSVGSGSFVVRLKNDSASNKGEAVTLNFAVIKAVTS